MNATTVDTTDLVVAICLVAAVGSMGYASATAIGEPIGVVSADSEELTADDIRNVSFDPNPANPGDEVQVSAELFNESAEAPVEDAVAEFEIFTGDGEIPASNTTDRSDADGRVGSVYIPDKDDIGETTSITIESGEADRTVSLDVEASAAGFRDETADPDPVDPGNETDIAARVVDERDEAFDGADVSFEIASGTGNLTVTQGTSDGDGWVNASYEAADDDAGQTVEFNVTADETDANTTIPVTVTSNIAGFEDVIAEPATPAADENVSLSARVLDEANNLLSNTTVDVGTNGTGTFDPSALESNETGYIETKYVPTRADNDTAINLTLAPGTDAETTETVVFDPLTITGFENESAPETVDPGSNATLTGVALDEFDEPIANRTVELAASGGDGELNTTQVETDSEGRIAATYESVEDDAGAEITVDISPADTAAATNVSFSVTTSPASVRNVSVDPSTADPGESVTVSGEIRDESESLLEDANVTFDATTDGDDPGSFDSSTATSDTDGEVTATFTPADAAANQTVTFEITANQTDISNSTTLNVSANVGAIVTELADPDPVDPGNETNVSAQLVDESGSVLPGANVTFSANGTEAITADRNTSDTDGWVNATYEASSDDAGTTVGVDIDADDTDATATVAVEVTANPTNFGNESASPETVEPGSEANLSTQVFDESGTPLSGIDVTVEKESANGTLVDPPSESNEDGWINVTYETVGEDANTTAEIGVVAGEDANTTIPVTVSERAAESFNRAVADPSTIDPVEAEPWNNNSTIAVQVLDQVDEELADAPINFSIVEGTGEGELNTTNTTTSTNGWANVTYSAVGDDANQTIEIKADAVDRAVSETIEFEVTANADRFTNKTVTPQQPEPNESTEIAIQVLDESSTPLSEAGIELTVTQGNSTLENAPAESNDEGWINASYTPDGEDVNTTVEIEITANETEANETISFDVSERAAGSFNQTFADPAAIDPINTTTRHNETTIAVQVLDQVDEELADAPINFSVAEGTGEGELNTTSTNSSTDGWANVTYSAVAADANQTIEIEADAVDRAVSETIAFDVTATADGFTNETVEPAIPEPNESTNVAIQVLDESETPLSEAAVELNVTRGNSTLERVPTESNDEGWINASYTPVGEDANTTVEIEITANETEANETVSFDVSERAADSFDAKTVDPVEINPVATDEKENTTELAAQVLDQLNEPLDGADVSFDIESGTGDLTVDRNTSAEGGWVNASYQAAPDDANTTVEISINATDRDAETILSVEVDANPNSFDAKAADPDPVDPAEPTTITAQVLDESTTVLPDADVEFVVADGNGTFSEAGETTTVSSNDTGIVEAVYEPDRTDANETVDIGLQAVETGITTNVTVEIEPLQIETVDPEPADPAEVDPVETGDRSNETNISAQVLDQFDEPLADANVTFEDDGEGTLTVDRDTSDTEGWVNATYHADREDAGETVTVDITANDTDAEASVEIEVTANPDRIQDAAATPAPAADQSVDVNATVASCPLCLKNPVVDTH